MLRWSISLKSWPVRMILFVDSAGQRELNVFVCQQAGTNLPPPVSTNFSCFTVFRQYCTIE